LDEPTRRSESYKSLELFEGRESSSAQSIRVALSSIGSLDNSRAITSRMTEGRPVSFRALQTASNAWPITFVAASSKTPRGKKWMIDATRALCPRWIAIIFLFPSDHLWN
jgi:hypothetical protein